MPTTWRNALVAIAAIMAISCRGRVPDVGGFASVLQADGRVVEILQEADSLAERNPGAAARDLRETALPRARANADAAGRINATHPRARVLLRELVRVTGERAATIEQYASALETNDVAALRGVLSRQISLDRSVDRLESDVLAATQAAPDRGCSVAR